MKKLWNQYREIITYLIFGVLTTVVSIASYYVAAKVFGINWQVSNVISFICAVLFAYITNKLFVFQSKGNILKEFISFVGMRLVSFGLDMALMYAFVDLMKMDDMIAKVIVQVVVVVSNYLFSKLFIFKKDN